MENVIFMQEGTLTKSERERLHGNTAYTVWFTGLSGSGKSTLAHALEQQLYLRNKSVYVLDGDNIRHGLCNDLGFSEEDRFENVRRVSEVAKLLVDAGIITIVALITPFKAQRSQAKELLRDSGYVEIFCKCDLKECEKRDVKGLYKRARAKKIEKFTGITSPYEEPIDPDLIIETDKNTIDQGLNNIFNLLKLRKLID